MKLPFNAVLGPVLKSNFTYTKLFCKNPTFFVSIPYTYVYGTTGLFVNIHHLKKHLGENPLVVGDNENVTSFNGNEMLVHDLKMIATSLGLIQYTCLLIGCITENPSLFLPHLTGQFVSIAVRIFNVFLVLVNMNCKTTSQLLHKLTAIVLMTFNWLQEFCVFRQYLCVCDL